MLWAAWPAWAVGSLIALLLIWFALLLATRSTRVGSHDDGAEFARFQRQYLVVYLLVMFADWLQGTNMYTLYKVFSAQ